MLGISPSEILLIAVLAFLIIGPKRLADASHEFGKLIRRFKSQWKEIKETRLHDVDATPFYEVNIELNKTIEEIKQSSQTKLLNDDSQHGTKQTF